MAQQGKGSTSLTPCSRHGTGRCLAEALRAVPETGLTMGCSSLHAYNLLLCRADILWQGVQAWGEEAPRSVQLPQSDLPTGQSQQQTLNVNLNDTTFGVTWLSA